jgi:hypothetical protein
MPYRIIVTIDAPTNPFDDGKTPIAEALNNAHAELSQVMAEVFHVPVNVGISVGLVPDQLLDEDIP